MKTEVIQLDRNHIDLDKLRHAAAILRDGGLVAFPTETVYGLGANALDETAVKSIFLAKGRPSDNPLIVHIADSSELTGIVEGIPSAAPLLIEHFWPGPLTLVMNKSQKISHAVSAGLETVAVRLPAHPIAQALIRESGVPIAAPSANLSGRPSPTSAEHVITDLMGKVDMIIDGGSANVGLESTVLDLTVNPPMILRPGGITPGQLQAVLGKVGMDPALRPSLNSSAPPKAPGMKYTHYSPKADLMIVEGELNLVVSKIRELIWKYQSEGKQVGVLATEQTKGNYPTAAVLSMGDRLNPETIAANLFGAFRDFDRQGVQVILAESIENTGIGIAIMNRMTKAAGYNIISATDRQSK